MNDPENIFWIQEIYEEQTANHENPKEIVFGKEITYGARNLIHQYDLKKRDYLGTTSMDAELSLIASNLGLVRFQTLILIIVQTRNFYFRSVRWNWKFPGNLCSFWVPCYGWRYGYFCP